MMDRLSIDFAIVRGMTAREMQLVVIIVLLVSDL